MKRLVGVWRWALVLVFSAAPTAHAGVTVENTRTIYPAGQKTVSVLLKNEGDRPSLVQVWISDGDLDQSPNVSRAPFVLDKPMLRLEPGSSYAIRVRSIPQMAPQGKREYLYWLNVLEIPSRDESADNEVQIAVRLRMKLFYRPAGVAAPVAPDTQVTMRAVAGGLQLHNASNHYFNVGTMTLVSAAGERAINSFHLEPGETRTVPLPADFGGALTEVRYAWVDDDGVLHPQARRL